MMLEVPLKHVLVTQPFGVNYVGKGFYQKLGVPADAHNGIDFRCHVGAKCYAAHDGIVLLNETATFGKYIVLNGAPNGTGLETTYGHLSDFISTDGQRVKKGELMALTGDSGTACAGAHLHFHLREKSRGAYVGYNNGYHGCTDPAQYFPKNWDMPPAYHRYGRRREYLAEVKMRFNNIWLHRQLLKMNQIKKIYDDSFINALVYGGWGFDEITNPAITDWMYVTKEDYKKGIYAFK